MRRVGIAAIVLAATIAAAAAQGMKSPRISHATVDGDALDAELGAIEGLEPGTAANGSDQWTATETRAERLGRLNRAMEEQFGGIAASQVPVLLPFETAADLRDRALAGNATAGAAIAPIGKYLAGFQGVPFFQAGPSGYDAVVVARGQEMRDLGIRYSKPVYIHISGSALIYEIDRPVGMIGWPVNGGLELEFPGIKRLFLDNYVRYTFLRYGMPYTVAIECFDGGSRFGRISCREADKVAVRMLKALRFAGGTPRRLSRSVPSLPSPEMGSGESGRAEHHRAAGRAVRPSSRITARAICSLGPVSSAGAELPTIPSIPRIRFPVAQAPAFANSQSFMNWGNCEATGRVGLGMRGRTAAYRCKVNSQPLIRDESAPGELFLSVAR